VEVRRRVDPLQFRPRGRTRLVPHESGAQPRGVEPVDARAERGGSFGGPATRVVVEEAGVGGEQDGHRPRVSRGSGATRWVPVSSAEMTIASPHRALRVRPWPVDPTTAHLVPSSGRGISPAALRATLDELTRAGYRRARTAALSPSEQRPFLDAGFQVDEHLHLLAHPLTDLPPRPEASLLRRARRWDRPAVLAGGRAPVAPPR